MGLKRVLIQGEAYPVLYDMYGLAKVMEISQCTFGDILEKAGRFQDFTKMQHGDLLFVFDLVYAGFINGCEEEGMEFPFSKRELSRLIPLVSEEMNQVMEEFQKGMTSFIAADEQKKTSTPTRKTASKKVKSA